ncbi:acyclic terpene utilization AtuA family protein [Actinophytocola sp.]|uniref:acyclic terpene utilization AtuA family protein n=1 Tax=Actinophytocola sp. TaxID=1872138 RepID=UPI003899A734
MSPRRPVRIASFSGGMGDRFAAFKEAVHGEPVDALIGDSMTEFIESMMTARFIDEPEKHREFFSPLFVAQLLPELPAVAEKKLKIVTNAGVHAPLALAEKIRDAVRTGGLDLRVAGVTGDDLYAEVDRLAAEGQLVNTDTGESLDTDERHVLAADAYLGAWGVKSALDAGADIVITGRVADASLISGVAAWWHGWGRDELDRIAGAVAAGHIIECGAQATGGNFTGFTAVPGIVVPGFPIAEVADDGDCVITKRAGEGGMVTVDTVTAQLVYEIQGPRYLNPDVTWHTDSVTVTQEGPDRVRVSGAKGSAPVETTRVGMHLRAGYRGSMWYFATGLQIDEKVEVLRRQAELAAGEARVRKLRLFVCGRAVEDPADQWQATVPVKVTVAAATAAQVEAFVAQLNSYWLGGFPGFYTEITQIFADSAQARIDYWPGLVRQDSLRHQAHLPDGRVVDIPPPSGTRPYGGQPAGTRTPPADLASFGPTVRRPLGHVVHARVGDKAGNANLGFWVSQDDAYPWLLSFLTTDRLVELLASPTATTVERYELPKLRGLCFVLQGYLGPSSSAGLSLDQLGKSLGEFLRARHVDVPVSLLPARS